MRKLFYIIIGILLLFGMHFLLTELFPKSVGRIPVFVGLFLLDIYLYSSYHKKIWSWNKTKAWLVTLLYWLPSILVLILISGSIVKPFKDWNKLLAISIQGFLLMSYSAKLIPIIFLVIADIFRLIKKTFQNKTTKESDGEYKISRSAFLRKAGLIGGGIVFGGLFTGIIKWVHDYKIWNETVRIPNLPNSFEGLKIIQFSDFHLGSWVSNKDLQEAVDTMNEMEADLVFFTGDLVNFSTAEALPYQDILVQIKAKYGVYCVLGNHDYGDYVNWKTKKQKEDNMRQMYKLYKDMGWKLLRNENDIINDNGNELAIIGVENWGSMGRFPKHGDLSKAIKGVENIPVKILLSHDPTHWQYKVKEFDHTINLTFSGHTHGGQVGIEIPGFRWSPAQYVYKYWAGMYSAPNQITGGEQHLYVNRGIGAIGYTGRIGIKPEITLVELTS
jgi:hypothetical protein